MGTISISYTTGVDGFGDGEVTEADLGSFEAYVEHRLAERFPGADVRAEISDRYLESRVRVRGIDVDESELRSWIGNEVWESWCAGERAPSGDESEVAS